LGSDRAIPLGRYFGWAFALGFLALAALVIRKARKTDQAFWSSRERAADARFVERFVKRTVAYQPEPQKQPTRPVEQHHASLARAVAATQGADENFSFVLFEDFLHALYVETQKLRGGKKLELLSPFLSEQARATYESLPADAVTMVIVGGMETESARSLEDRIWVSVRFEANYTETRGQDTASFYVREVWLLSRESSGRSRPSDLSRVIGCGNCGAPLEKILGATCEHCGAVAGAGRRDWFVTAIAVEAPEPRGPMLTGTTEEEGTNLPTLVAPDAQESFVALCRDDPALSWTAFSKRLELLFHTFHRSWSRQDLAAVRGFLTDNLFDTQTYWVEAYKAQKLRNITEQAEIVTIHCSRILRDPHYDAITVRVYAQCLDYTLDESGTLVGGSRDALRQYSEYWTLIRASGRRGAPRTEPTCPNCGAPADQVGPRGECTSCRVKVTNGAYDWTLSRIEQDEVYRL
jgi:Tim44-like domain